MIKKVYYGDPAHYGTGTVVLGTSMPGIAVSSKDSSISVSTFNIRNISSSALSRLENVKKIDILFYNRVNEKGKVLSSVVYLSEIREGDETSEIFYRPRYLYKNSSVELAMNLDGVVDFAYFNYIRHLEEPSSYFTPTRVNSMPVHGYPSPIVSGNFAAEDGWYTLASVGIHYRPSDDNLAAMKKGGLCISNEIYWTEEDGNDPLPFGPVSPLVNDSPLRIALVDFPTQSNPADWHYVYVFDSAGTVSTTAGTLLGTCLNESIPPGPASDWYPIYARQDFFIMSNFDYVYKKLLRDRNYKTPYNPYVVPFRQLAMKYRPIKRLLEEQNFKEAQLYLQSTEYVRLENTEI
jgi:hypothetical protein